MAIVRWHPLRELEEVQHEMNRLFDSLITLPHDGFGSAFVPPVELEETPDAYTVKLEVPGMEANDLDIQATAESISISGERRSETKTEEKGITRSEFRYGKFQRVIPLPGRINNQAVEAEYKDGILALTLPKVEEERNKVVKVNLG